MTSTLSLKMHAVLLATLLVVSSRPCSGMSSMFSADQRCCFELEILRKVFVDTDYECLLEDCVAYVQDMRAATINSTIQCPVPDFAMCQKFAQADSTAIASSTGAGGLQNAHLTAWNILRVLDTQSWRNCVIVYDLDAWPVLEILTASLSERHIDFIMYDVTSWTMRPQYRHLLADVWGRLHINTLITVTNIVSVEKLFREARAYDVRLGRTSGQRMFTRWIVATSSDRRDRLRIAAKEFDNVVAIFENTEVISLNSSVTDSKAVQCMTLDVTSLMYITDGETRTREFQSATILTSQNEVIVNDTFPNIRHNFNGRTLTIATKEWPPFVITANESDGSREFKGLCMDMLRELSSVLNFSYVIVEPPWEEGWGDLTEDGNWTGLVGMLQRQDVDVVVAPLSFSTKRALIMDSTVPFATNTLAAVFRMPDPMSSKWKTYLRPFRAEVFLCLGVTLIGFTGIVHLVAWMNPTNRSQRNKKKKSFPGPSPDDGFWYLYGALLSQGGMRLPQSGSGRMLISTWWLFSIVIGATYSGNLIAFLTVQLEDKPFETMAELLEQDTYSWGILGKTSTEAVLMEAKNPVLKGLGDGIKNRATSDPSVRDIDYQVHQARVAAGDYAFITDSISAEAWVRDECDFAMIRSDAVSMPVDPYAVYLPRHSAFTRLFNEYMMRIVEAGLIEKWKRDWWTDSLRCAKGIVTESEAISVFDVQSVLYAGLVGFGLALISLGCEFVFHRHPKLLSWAKKLAETCAAECTENPETHQQRRRGSRDQGNDRSDNNNDDGQQDRHLEDTSLGEDSQTPDVVVEQNGGVHSKSDDLSAFDFSRARTFKFTYNTMFSPTFSTQADFGRSRRNSDVFSTDEAFRRNGHSHLYSTPSDFGRVGNNLYSTPEDFGRGELAHMFSSLEDFGRRASSLPNGTTKAVPNGKAKRNGKRKRSKSPHDRKAMSVRIAENVRVAN